MNCKNCPYYDKNLMIPIISNNHPTYYKEVDYCRLSGEYELTIEDLQINCPLEEEVEKK